MLRRCSNFPPAFPSPQPLPKPLLNFLVHLSCWRTLSQPHVDSKFPRVGGRQMGGADERIGHYWNCPPPPPPPPLPGFPPSSCAPPSVLPPTSHMLPSFPRACYDLILLNFIHPPFPILHLALHLLFLVFACLPSLQNYQSSLTAAPCLPPTTISTLFPPPVVPLFPLSALRTASSLPLFVFRISHIQPSLSPSPLLPSPPLLLTFYPVSHLLYLCPHLISCSLPPPSPHSPSPSYPHFPHHPSTYIDSPLPLVTPPAALSLTVSSALRLLHTPCPLHISIFPTILLLT
jgi:hypothetical protein